MRTEHARVGLDEGTAVDDPIALAQVWTSEAVAAGVLELNAMARATASAAGEPSVRIVLLKVFDASGAVFFTNYDSRKVRELAENPRASAVLLWHPLYRQVRIEGAVTRLDAHESDAYFAARLEGARISAAAVASRRGTGRAGPPLARGRARGSGRPPARGLGWLLDRIAPEVLEFWHGRENRLHERIRFTRDGNVWTRDRLAP